jgi:hypothetical protein
VATGIAQLLPKSRYLISLRTLRTKDVYFIGYYVLYMQEMQVLMMIKGSVFYFFLLDDGPEMAETYTRK